MVSNIFPFQCNAGALDVSIINGGTNINVPVTKIAIKKTMDEIAAGFFFTSVLYTAKENALASIHRSPVPNLNCASLCQLPCDNKKRIPPIQRTIPEIRKPFTFSFKKMVASMVAKMGAEVVPINARLMADV